MALPKLVLSKEHTPAGLVVLHDVATARLALNRSFKHTPANMWPPVIAAHAKIIMQPGRPNRRGDLIQLAALASAAAEAAEAEKNPNDELQHIRRCRRCGCTDNHACLGSDGEPCYWVEEDLCSNCDAVLRSQETETRQAPLPAKGVESDAA